MNASRITNYYQNQPDRRTVFVLDAVNGHEFTFDLNNDGKAEYAPFTWSGVTHSGTKYPPVINGIDGVLLSGYGLLFGRLGFAWWASRVEIWHAIHQPA